MSSVFRLAASNAVAIVALLGSSPLLAQSAAELDQRAVNAYNRGLDARDAGQNRAACEHFRNAETLYHNSIMALMNRPMYTDELRDEVKQMADSQQSRLNGAKAKVNEICGRPDDPPPPVRSSPPPSSYQSSPTPSAASLAGSVGAVQSTIDTAYANAQDAVARYKARDFAGACASARASNENYIKARDQARAITKATGSFRDLSYDDINAVDNMANNSGYEVKEFYCAN